MELDPAIQKASHESIACADRVDDRCREARHSRYVATWLDGHSATWPERDHSNPEPILLDPCAGQFDGITTVLSGATGLCLGEELDVLITCLDDALPPTHHPARA